MTEIGLFIKSSGADQFLEKIKSSKDQNPLGALITFRFDTLQPLLQTVIKYASAIGDKFTSDLLGAIIPHHYELHAAGSSREEGLACLLEQLVRKGFIHSVATAAATASNKDVNTFVFQHELVRDTIYSQWPPRSFLISFFIFSTSPP